MTQPVHIAFIHGLANKPAPKELRRIWLDALKVPMSDVPGFDLGAVGVTDSFVYTGNVPAFIFAADNEGGLLALIPRQSLEKSVQN